jgi:hypothetical protein
LDPCICSASYDNGTPVTLTATPGFLYAFTGWNGGGCSGTGPCTVTLRANTTVTATFRLLGLFRLLRVYDFDYENEITTHKENFTDSVHFTKPVAAQLIRKIWEDQVQYARKLKASMWLDRPSHSPD